MTNTPDVELIRPNELETGVTKITVYVNEGVTEAREIGEIRELRRRLIAFRHAILSPLGTADHSSYIVEFRHASRGLRMEKHIDVVLDIEVPRELVEEATHKAYTALQEFHDAVPLRMVLRLVPVDAVQLRTIGATVASAAQTAGLTVEDLLQ